MTRITHRSDNVIHVNFAPPPAKNPHSGIKRTPSGVFIKPSGADTTMWAIKGNVAGYIASYIAFHPEFSPDLFGRQVRAELGTITANDYTPEPPHAA